MTEFESWKKIIELFKENKKVMKTVKYRYASSIYYYLVMFYFESEFQPFKKEFLKEYRKNIYNVIRSVKTFRAVILRILVYICPKFFIPKVARKQLLRTISNIEI